MRRIKKPSSINLGGGYGDGRCRYCKCTDARACPEGCSWYDDQQTVCDSPRCVARFRVALAEAARKLIRIGIKKTGIMKTLSCYSEAAVIIDTLLAELRRDEASIEA